jgi:hypothetical protein
MYNQQLHNTSFHFPVYSPKLKRSCKFYCVDVVFPHLLSFLRKQVFNSSKLKADPEDHFEVADVVLVKLKNPKSTTLTTCQIVPSQHFTKQIDLKAF